MKCRELIEQTGWINCTPELDLETEVSDVIVSDLLSWVMGKGQAGSVWITVQSHLNIIAVALLRDFSCIVIADDAPVSQDVIDKAKEEGLILLQSHQSSYQSAKRCVELGL